MVSQINDLITILSGQDRDGYFFDFLKPKNANTRLQNLIKIENISYNVIKHHHLSMYSKHCLGAFFYVCDG